MNPEPIQKPRPPLMIGGNGPRMLKIAAQYADTWNTFGGMDVKSCEEMLTLTCKRNKRIDRILFRDWAQPNHPASICSYLYE